VPFYARFHRLQYQFHTAVFVFEPDADMAFVFLVFDAMLDGILNKRLGEHGRNKNVFLIQPLVHKRGW
jgi:hypothetical protein